MANTKVKTLEIIADDGRIKVPVKNLHGDQIGEFYFNPTDAGMPKRYNELVERLPEIVKPLDDANNEQEFIAAIETATQELNAEIDKLFAGNAAEAFFGQINPFSMCNGMFYFAGALQSIGAFIDAQYDVQTKKVNERIGKYTKGLKS